MKPKQFAVIGIGRFGESLTKELVRMGYEVLAVDVDADLVQEAVEYSTHAVQADAMEESVSRPSVSRTSMPLSWLSGRISSPIF